MQTLLISFTRVCREHGVNNIFPTYVCNYFLWLGGKGSSLSVACRYSCGSLDPPKYFYLYLQAFLVKHAIDVGNGKFIDQGPI